MSENKEPENAQSPTQTNASGPLTEAEIIDGGRLIEVRKRDGSTETILVREVPFLRYKSWATAVNNQRLEDELCFYLEGGIKAAKQLTQGAIRQVRDIGREVNTDFLDMVLEDQNPMAFRQMKEATEAIKASANRLDTSLQALSEGDSESPTSEPSASPS